MPINAKGPGILVVVIIIFLLFQSFTIARENDLTNADSQRRNNVLHFSSVVGGLSGAAMGVFILGWELSGHDDINGGLGTELAITLPSMVIGAYVGSFMTRWSAQQIMKGSPKPVKATFKGVLYGTISGAVIGTAAIVPMLAIGHITGGITFNEGNNTLLKVIGTATMGGSVFGGMIGTAVGAVYGPAISIYMKF